MHTLQGNLNNLIEIYSFPLEILTYLLSDFELSELASNPTVRTHKYCMSIWLGHPKTENF